MENNKEQKMLELYQKLLEEENQHKNKITDIKKEIDKLLVESDNEIQAVKEKISDLSPKEKITAQEVVEKPIEKVVEKPIVVQSEKTNTVKSKTQTSINVPKKEVQTKPVTPTTTNTHQSSSFDFENIMTNFLPKIFLVILLLGVVFGFKLGSDYGYITDTMKLIMGYALSIGLAFFGFHTHKKGQKVFALTLFSGVLAVGVLTTFAGAILYEMLPFMVSLISIVAYVSFGLFVSYKLNSEVMSIFSIIVAIFVAYMLHIEEIAYGYILVYLSLTYFAFQYVIRVKKQYLSYLVTHFGAFLSFTILSFIWLQSVNVTLNTQLIISSLMLLMILITVLNMKHLKNEVYEHHFIKEDIIPYIAHPRVIFTSYLWLLLISLSFNFDIIVQLIITVFYIGLLYFIKKDSFKDIVYPVLVIQALVTVSSLSLSPSIEETIKMVIALAVIYLGYKYKSLYLKLSAVVTVPSAIILYLFAWEIRTSDLVVPVIMLLLLAVAFGYLVKLLIKFESKVVYHIFSIMSYLLVIYVVGKAFGHSGIENDIVGFITTSIILALTYVAYKYMVTNKNVFDKFKPLFIINLVVFAINAFVTLINYINNDEMTTHILFTLSHIAILLFLFELLRKLKDKFKDMKVSLNLGYITVAFFVVYTMLSKTLSILELDEYTSLSFTILLLVLSLGMISFGNKVDTKVYRNIGFGLIITSVTKLIFLDLTGINLFVRTMVFIITGAIGLVYSKHLLNKNSKALEETKESTILDKEIQEEDEK